MLASSSSLQFALMLGQLHNARILAAFVAFLGRRRFWERATSDKVSERSFKTLWDLTKWGVQSSSCASLMPDHLASGAKCRYGSEPEVCTDELQMFPCNL